MGGTPSSDRIIEDVDQVLESFEIVFHTNGAAVEEPVDRNEHRLKEVSEG